MTYDNVFVKVAGKDDETGEDLIQRDDDKPESVRNRQANRYIDSQDYTWIDRTRKAMLSDSYFLFHFIIKRLKN